jgi:hypothetical protein
MLSPGLIRLMRAKHIEAKRLEEEGKLDNNINVLSTKSVVNKVSVEAPVEVLVEVSVEAPVEVPVEAPVDAPVEASVEAPVEASVEASVEAPVEETEEENNKKTKRTRGRPAKKSESDVKPVDVSLPELD